MPMSDDERQEALQRLETYPGPMLGLAEVAKILGLKKQTLSNRVSRGTFPPPLKKLAMGPVWTSQQIFEALKTL